MLRRGRTRSRWSRGGKPDKEYQDPACSHCTRPFDTRTTPVYIKCHAPECLAINYSLCLDCYSVGAGLPPHRSDHSYTIVEPLDAVIFDPEWTAKDECKLLDALLKHGIHKWDLVASEVGKSAYKCETHYFKTYLGKSAPLPTSSLESSLKNSAGPAECDENRAKIEVHSIQKPESDAGSVPPSVEVDENPSMLHEACIIGEYVPKRREYKLEFDDTAEELIADLEINENDSEEQRQVKENILMLFNRRLELREDANYKHLPKRPLKLDLSALDVYHRRAKK